MTYPLIADEEIAEAEKIFNKTFSKKAKDTIVLLVSLINCAYEQGVEAGKKSVIHTPNHTPNTPKNTPNT